ncbi:MAG: hypothetical protein HYY00_06175 [Chloroflexi bacterium]|nr:hypothetical protein [Chloroflexota bacterium]
MAKEGRRFLVDEKGRKQGIVLSLREYQRLMEDLADLAIIAERKDEEAVPWDEAKADLERLWRTTP